MSLVTPEAARTRGGWRVTEMGRVVRVMRMRPERPLEPPRATTSAGSKKREIDGKGGTRKQKKRVKPPPARARRRTIDPTRWDSVHLKGIWLDAEVAGAVESNAGLGRSGDRNQVDVTEDADGHIIPRKRRAGEAESSDDENDYESVVETEDEDNDHESASSLVPESAFSPLPPLELPPTASAVGENVSLSEEQLASLALLHSLFNDKDGDEGWGGQESLSDVEDAHLERRGESQAGTRMVIDEGADGAIEEVPRAKFKDMEIGSDTSDGMESQVKSQPQPMPQPEKTTQNETRTKLKDLFAPKEDEGAFCYFNYTASFLSPFPRSNSGQT